MLRSHFICLYLLITVNSISTNLFAQEAKRNYVWAIGYEPVTKFNFNSSSLISIDTVLNSSLPIAPACAISSSAGCISDTFGNLLTFSNGFILYDRDGFGLENGVYVNCPKGKLLADHYGGWSPFTQTSIILPKKGNTYYVFSTGMSDSNANDYLNHVKSEFDVLNYSIVDMDSNASKGKVTVKNKLLMEGQRYANCALSAVRHGNGKDWWLVKADCNNNRYQLFQVKEDTILGPFYQYATDTAVSCYPWGQLYFSEDGNKMASAVYTSRYYDTSGISIPPQYLNTEAGLIYAWNRVDLYDFDRCNGTISFKNNYLVPIDTSSYPNNDYKSGICFSPNGKLMYLSNTYTIYQIDLEDTNKLNGLLITGPDTVITQFQWYSEMACGPDGKLYVGSYGGSLFMSYIDQPNVKGLGCNFIPHGIWQPYTGLHDPPNMPNYGLGKAPVGGNCWPDEVLENDIPRNKFLIYPNPASNDLIIEIDKFHASKYELIICNSLGEVVLRNKEGQPTQNKIKLSISNLSVGIYSIKIITDQDRFIGKFVKE